MSASNGTILILDDEVLVRLLLQEILEPEGYVVLHTDDGFEALDWILDRGDVGLVLVNLNMPILPGRAFLQRLLELPIDRQPQRMVITGYLDVQQSDFAHAGVVDVLRKPFDIGSLRTRIRDVFSAADSRGREAPPQNASERPTSTDAPGMGENMSGA